MKSYDTPIKNDEDLGRRYWNRDKNQLNFIRDEFMEIYSLQDKSQIPIFETIEVKSFFGILKRTYSTTKIRENTFEKECWEEDIEIGDDLLGETMMHIIEMVCDYQWLRFHRVVGSGFLNDPRNLLCHELKTWCVKHCKGDIESIKSFCDNQGELLKRIQFIDRLIDDSQGHFKQGGILSDITLKEALNYTSKNLKSMYGILKTHIKNLSAREEFKIVHSNSKRLLRRCINMLHYGLHKDVVPQVSDIPSLIDPPTKPLKRIMNTDVGTLLQGLLKSPIFTRIKSPVFSKINGASLRSGHQKRDSVTDKLFESIQDLLPEYVQDGVVMSTDKNYFKKFNIVYHLLNSNQSETGIFELLNNETVVSEFVELHTLVKELAYFVYAGQLLYDLAGMSGELLIYGFINKPVEEVLRCYVGCIKQLIESFNSYFEKLNICKGELIVQRKTDVDWMINFKRVKNIHHAFLRSAETCLKHLNSVIDKAKGSNIKKLSKQIDGHLSTFVDTSQILCMRWGGVDITKLDHSTTVSGDSDTEAKASQNTQQTVVKDKTATSNLPMLSQPQETEERNMKKQPHSNTFFTSPVKQDQQTESRVVVSKRPKPEERTMKKVPTTNSFDESFVASEECSEIQESSAEALIEPDCEKRPTISLEAHLELCPDVIGYSKKELKRAFNEMREYDSLTKLTSQYIEMACVYLSNRIWDDSVEKNRLRVLKAGFACLHYFFENAFDETQLIDHIEAVCFDIIEKESNSEAKSQYFQFNRNELNSIFMSIGLTWLNNSALESQYKSLYIYILKLRSLEIENQISLLKTKSEKMDRKVQSLQNELLSNKTLFNKLQTEIENLRGQLNQRPSNSLRDVNRTLNARVAELEAQETAQRKTIDALSRAMNHQRDLINGRRDLEQQQRQQGILPRRFADVVNQENEGLGNLGGFW